ncbi:MAG: monofunctional biosynthetic peptidoglycan transglycosylase [Nitrospirales bacterium]|nr:monofunctional biosynthetic peptidoglycan transglycosylase [Nitrospirales bacterium]
MKRRRRRKQSLNWLYRNKVKTICLVVFLYLCLEVWTIPFQDIRTLKTENPDQTALMQQRQEEALQKDQRFVMTQHWVPLSTIPHHMRNAIVVAEDGAFYAHAGVDWYEVWESVQANWKHGRLVRGGSTITQQVAKNLYLSPAKTPIRKFKELIIAFLLEAHLSKGRILEIYLNSIEWGRGIFGIEAAAQTYFGKSASNLTQDESARLAVVVPNPRAYRPNTSQTYVLRKKQLVLERMTARASQR